MTFEKLEAIEGGAGGCLHCGYQHEILPLEGRIAVGFGSAMLTKNGEPIFNEMGQEWEDCMTFAEAEELAAADPDQDWRISLVAPLSERHYQRQGKQHWVLYEKGPGFT